MLEKNVLQTLSHFVIFKNVIHKTRRLSSIDTYILRLTVISSLSRMSASPTFSPANENIVIFPEHFVPSGLYFKAYSVLRCYK